MARRPSIAIVGSGNVAHAFARGLKAHGYAIAAILSRHRAAALAKEVGSSAKQIGKDVVTADLYLLCISDDAIASVAKLLARGGDWRGRVVIHTSGALTSRELDALKRKGASVASMHPMNTFVQSSRTPIEGTAMAIEGDKPAMRAAMALARGLKCPAFEISARGKPLYHAMGSFFSPLLISLLETGERIGMKAGVKAPRAMMLKILHRTIANYGDFGPDGAFSGPLRRGDVRTIARHLEALKRVDGAREIYRALAANAVKRLPAQKRARSKRLLKP